MPRHTATLPWCKKNLNLDPIVVAEVDMLQWDPTHGKPQYGSWSDLVNALLREWIAKQKGIRNGTTQA